MKVRTTPLYLFLGLSLALFLICSPALSEQSEDEQEPEAPAEVLTLDWTRRPLLFDHPKHVERTEDDCQACHHQVEGKVSYLPCANKGCHDNLNRNDESDRSYYQATHREEVELHQSCVSCHLERAGDEPQQIKRMAGCKQSLCHD